jgi:DNA-binding NtrC family response regulator
MYAAQRKVLTLLHDHKVTVDEAEELLSAMETQQRSLVPSIPKVELVGTSKWTQQFRTNLPKIAGTQSPVLIQGETGTGKELIARIIHYNSKYASGPFVPFHTALIDTSLINSEIFGHEQGAFTGAVSQKKGMLEIANDGTVCLDKIDALPLETQNRLHDFLVNGYFTRVGGTKPIYADVRIIGTTHGDLKQFVDQKKFRSDLYYRLSVCIVQSPPLRERLEDLPALVKHFVEQQAELDSKKPPKVSDAAINLLYEYHWPENVRELCAVILRAVVLCEGDEITPDYLPTLKSSQ